MKNIFRLFALLIVAFLLISASSTVLAKNGKSDSDNETPLICTGQLYADVPVGSLHYTSTRQLGCVLLVMPVFPCGGTGEPCDSQNRPYFRPAAYTSKHEIAEVAFVLSNFASWTYTPRAFRDVPTNHPQRLAIESLLHSSIWTAGPPFSYGADYWYCTNYPGFQCSQTEPNQFFSSGQYTDRRFAVKTLMRAWEIAPGKVSQYYGDITTNTNGYDWISWAGVQGIVPGFPCGQYSYEPCDAENRPYLSWINGGHDFNRGNFADIAWAIWDFKN